MNQNLIIGYDNGRLYTKVVSIEEKFIFLNAVSKGYEMRQIESKNDLPENQMDFELYENEKGLGRFFTGPMAVKHHNGDLIYSTSGMKKFSPEVLLYEKAKFIGALALAAFKQGAAKGEVIEAFVGTGLPIEEYFDSKVGNLDQFIAAVEGNRYKVIFKAAAFSHYEVEIKVRGIAKSAEGTSSLMGTMMTIENSKLIKSTWLDPYIKHGPIMVFNIGSSSFDIAVLNEDGSYDPRGFIGLEIGSEWALDYISRRLKEQYGYMPEKIELESLVLSGKNLRYRGETIELKEISREAYSVLLDKLRIMAHEALRKCNIKVDGLGAVFYTGGTVEFMTARLGTEAVKGIIKDVPGLISTDPIYDDARGYLTMAYLLYLERRESETGASSLNFDEELVEVN